MDRARKAAQQWAEQKPTLEIRPMVLLGRLGEAALVISRDRLNPVFAEFDLQPGEFDVLATLRRSGAPYAVTPTDLYEAAMISSGSMTNRLNRLETAGWVTRQPNPEDKRGYLVALTPSGLALIDRAVEAHVANQRDIVAGLTPQEQDQLSVLLEKLLASQTGQTDSPSQKGRLHE